MKRYRNAMAFAAMIVLLLVLLVMNLCIGSSSVPVSDVWLHPGPGLYRPKPLYLFPVLTV